MLTRDIDVCLRALPDHDLNRQQWVSVGPSSVAGRGLFANCLIPRGTIVGCYAGEVISLVEAYVRAAQGQASHIVRRGAVLIDGWTVSDSNLKALASFANSSRGTGRTANATLILIEKESNPLFGQIVLRASVDIPQSSEILVDYPWR